MGTPYLGELRIMSFNFAPKGWAQCNGQLLPINQNQALFSLFGTMYGGNGQTTFGLPDLRGRVPISFGSNSQGQVGGQETHTINTSEMTQHNHLLMADALTLPANNTSTAGPTTVFGQSGGIQVPPGSYTVSIYNTAGPNNLIYQGTIGNTGGGQAHANMQPYLVLNICVALQGIFPSRN